MKKCVALLSGGLDSLLVTRLMALQGIETIALHTMNCFHSSQDAEARKERLRADALRLGARDILFPDISDDVVELVKRPRYGHGRNLNPCIDCRIRTMRAGFDAMRETGADFVVTGEVRGQRPMSQRRDAMALADREVEKWGFGGLLLRPLSAKLLPGTIPEAEGWVDPARLYDISGRSRERQMALAAEVGLGAYPTPAGGCLLTDRGYSERLASLARFTPDWTAADAEFVKVGRHFQIHPGVRLAASRREEENRRLEELARPDDRLYINAEKNGAVVLLRGEADPESERLAAGLAVYFSKMREAETARVECWRRIRNADTPPASIAAGPIHPDVARRMERECLRGRDGNASDRHTPNNRRLEAFPW